MNLVLDSNKTWLVHFPQLFALAIFFEMSQEIS